MAVPKRILVIGDVMTDITARLSGPIAFGSDRRADISVHPGGSAATQAVWLARYGLNVDFVGKVGAADREREYERLRAAGVTAHLAVDWTRETGRLIALVDSLGERSFLTDRGANDFLEASDIPDALIAAADHIHVSGYTMVSPSARAAVVDVVRRARGKPISVDPGSAEFLRELSPATFFDAIAGAGVLIPNAEEAATLAESEDAVQQRERLCRRFGLVVVKRGAAGAEAWRDQDTWRVAAQPSKVVDTTGAGDAFAAAFLASWLVEEDVPTCLARAVAAGSAATEFLGACPPYE